jgi:hypothetical protein
VKRTIFTVFGTWCLLAVCFQIRAELPPTAYPDPRDAPEDLDIKVLAVSKRVTEDNKTLTRWDIEVKAEVRQVRKTGSGLQRGSRILIRYHAHRYKKRGWMGPGSQPILVRGEVCSAALIVVGENKDRYYIPGGAPYSTFGAPGKKK